MTQHMTLETDRLILTPLATTAEMAAKLLPVWNDEVWRRFSVAPVILTEEDALLQITRMLAPPKARYWIISLKQSGEVIGETGFIGNPGLPGFGWSIASWQHRQGYGREAARAALDWGFAHMGLDLVEVWLHPANTASRALAASLGFERQRVVARPHEQNPVSRLTEIWHLYPDSPLGAPGQGDINALASPRFNAVQPVLSMPDAETLKKEAAFLQKTLGFAICFAVEDRAILQRGAAQLHLDLPAKAPETLPIAEIRLPISGLDLAATTIPPEVWAQPVTRMPWGVREGVIITPAGHRLVLTEGF